MISLAIIKSLIFLLFILLLIYFAFVVAKKHVMRKDFHNSRIKVLANKQIHQKLSTTLLEVDGQKLFIACGQGAISFVKIDHEENAKKLSE